jgi:hypothetical protein
MRSEIQILICIWYSAGSKLNFCVGNQDYTDNTCDKSNREDDNLGEIETLLLRDQLLRSLTMRHQQHPDELKVLRVN